MGTEIDDVELYWDVFPIDAKEEIFRLKQKPTTIVVYRGGMVSFPATGITCFALFALNRYIREKYLPSQPALIDTQGETVA